MLMDIANELSRARVIIRQYDGNFVDKRCSRFSKVVKKSCRTARCMRNVKACDRTGLGVLASVILELESAEVVAKLKNMEVDRSMDR
jgi:hypothetical protein